LGVALGAGAVERETGGVGADPLPRLHLPLVALLRNLLVEIEVREGVHDIRCERLRIDVRLRLVQALPMDLRALAEARYHRYAGDPVSWRVAIPPPIVSHQPALSSGNRFRRRRAPCLRGKSRRETASRET